ncbi:O52N2 protein, partial [Polypterus senegalus]
MYLFIGTLAFFDLLNSSNVNPKMVAVILDSSVILYGLCFFQMILRCHLEMSESFLFALMACDRYVAVVYPLRYPTLITNKVVWMGILLLNITSIVLLLPYMFFAAELSFCRGNVLPYCFCDYVTMVHVSCNEDPKYLLTLSSTVTMVGIVPLTIILFSYIRIVKAALKISSVDGKRKVFSTCLTHLIVMGLFYFPLLVSYGLPGIGVRLSNEAYSVMVKDCAYGEEDEMVRVVFDTNSAKLREKVLSARTLNTAMDIARDGTSTAGNLRCMYTEWLT